MGTAFSTKATHLADQRSYDDESTVETIWADRGYGGIYTEAAQSAQSITNGATAIQITNWTHNSDQSDGVQVVPDYAGDEVGVTAIGKYEITYHGNLTLVNAIAYTFQIFVGGVAVGQEYVVSGLTAVPDKTVHLHVFANVAAAGDIDVRVKHGDGSPQNITVLYQSLNVRRVA